MNLGSMATFITSKLGKSDAASVALCKGFIRQRHEMVYDSGLWKDSLVIKCFDLPTRDATDSNPYTEDISSSIYEMEFALPYEIARPIDVIYNSNHIGARDMQFMFASQPSDIKGAGVPVSFTEIEPVAVSKLTTNEPFKVQLKAYVNAADNGVAMHFKGILNDLPVHEDLSLANGNYYGSQDFDTLLYVSKPVTSGEVLFSNGSSTETIPAEETKYSLVRLRLNLQPTYVSGETIPLVVLGKKRIRPMRHDSDEAQIRNIDNALIAFTEGDMLERGRQYGKAQIKYSEGTQMVQLAQDVERGQSAAVSVLHPNSSGEYTRDDFGF